MANICFLQHTYITGSGTDSLIYQWGKRLVQKGHNVSVVCLRTDKWLKDEGILVLRIKIPLGGTKIGSGVLAPILGINKRRELQSLLNDYYDVVVTQLYPASLVPYFIRNRKFKWVHIEWTTPELFSGFPEYLYYSLAAHWNGRACTKADKVLVGSKFNQEWVKAYYNIEPKFMYLDGVDFDLFDIKKYGSPTGSNILFVGRLVPHKNISMLLMAMPTIIKEVKDAHLTIVGSQPSKRYMDLLLGIVKRLKLQDNVTFTGPVSWKDLPRYYAESAVFCSPSLWEGFLRAEASAMGKPMIGFGQSANPETLIHTGSIATPITQSALGHGILQFLQNPDFSGTVAKQGYTWTRKNLDLDIITTNLEKELL